MSFWAEMWLTATVCGVAANVAFLIGNRRAFRRILRSHRELRASREAASAALEGARVLAFEGIERLNEQMRKLEEARAELVGLLAKARE